MELAGKYRIICYVRKIAEGKKECDIDIYKFITGLAFLKNNTLIWTRSLVENYLTPQCTYCPISYYCTNSILVNNRRLDFRLLEFKE